MKRDITMKTDKALGIAALMLSVLLVMASSAKAAEYSFDFIANDSSYSVSGLFNTPNVTNGISNGSSTGYDITSISGLVTGIGGGPILSLVNNPNQPNPTTNTFFIYDNIAFPTEPYLDYNGVLFTLGGADTWNLFGNGLGGPGNYELLVSNGTNYVIDVHGNMTLTAVPEPEIYAMMAAGLGLMGFVARRRQRKLATA
jgi:hypothetical protein